MQEIKNARKKLDDKLGLAKSQAASKGAESGVPQPVKQNKFVRVAIQEESDEDEEESEKPKETFEVGKEEAVASDEPKPQAPGIQEVDSKENPNWWKKSSETLNYDDFNVEQKGNGAEDIDGSEFLKQADVMKK